jgi:transcriptional regulator with XRE-family HTH domain
MNTVERIKTICKERKIAISKLEKECGFSNGYISQLRKGTVPDDRLRVIAEYLELSTNYLMTGSDSKYSDADALLDVRISEDAELKEAIRKYYSLDDRKKKHVIELINLLSEG